MSSSRALRLQSALRNPILRTSAQLAPRRGYAVKEPPAPNPINPSGSAPSRPTPSPSNPKVGTKPDEISNRQAFTLFRPSSQLQFTLCALYLVLGVAAALGGTFAFLTGAPDRAAGVADSVTRGGGPSITPGLGPKPSSERNLENTTGRDANRQTGLAGIKSKQTDPNQLQASN
ncbi:uncharacterized protein CLUP02_02871 [Colletotrichum lupini]|uniref:Uncharacterized protein n=1 Tax=Colletotrichum lupini TaxID=145971 RepID=A0A9Q8SHV4_9PEZI|nr:uncharacterized protein CLUP02_02871 [Colletotrichum lupini]UQC77403.1 hypothetical protein CLUP02_02871 [Colletotrichum lupini]